MVLLLHMRDTINSIRTAFRSLYTYPAQTLTTKPIDYDAYWVGKRGDAIGTLTRWQRQRAELARECMHSAPPSSLLDIGCGDGAVSAYLKDVFKISRVVGLDISSTALVKARANGLETILVSRDIEESMSVAPNVDYVLLFEFLSQVPNPEEWLAQAQAKAKDGVVFSVPNSGYIAHRIRFCFGRFPVQWVMHPSQHIRFWTYTDVVWWLRALGYTKYTIRTYEGVPILKDIWPSLFARGLLVYLPKQ